MTTLTTLSLISIVSHLGSNDNLNNSDLVSQDSQVAAYESIEVDNPEPVEKPWTVASWIEHVNEDVRKGQCYQQIKSEFSRCWNLDHSIATRDWTTGNPRYHVMVTCHLYPEDAFVTAERNSPESLELLSDGSEVCSDDNRVWIKLEQFQY